MVAIKSSNFVSVDDFCELPTYLVQMLSCWGHSMLFLRLLGIRGRNCLVFRDFDCAQLPFQRFLLDHPLFSVLHFQVQFCFELFVHGVDCSDFHSELGILLRELGHFEP